MQTQTDDEDFVESSQPILRNKIKAYKQRILVKNFSALSPKKLEKSPVITQNKSDDKSQVNNNRTNKSSPEKRNRNISIGSLNDLFTPSKHSDIYDTSHLGEFEVVNMLHDSDAILELDDEKLLTDSMLNFTAPDVILNVNDSEVELAADPLSIENDNDCKPNTKIDQSPGKKPVTRSSRKKPNISSRTSFSTKTPKIQFQPRKSNQSKSKSSDYFKNEDFSLSDEEIEKEADSILEEVYNAQGQEVLSPQTIEKLNNLEVCLTHKVLPQHKIESIAGTHAPTQMQKKLFERFETMKKGKFTEEEDKIIKNNWKSFCKIHKWDEKNVQPFLYMRHQGKCYISNITERQKFVQFLANELPCRSLYSVYYRFRNLFAKKFHARKGRFTPEEDKKIMIYMKCASDSNQRFSELAKVLGRKRISIRTRYQILKRTSTPNSKRKMKREFLTDVIWTVPLIEEFLDNLMEVTLSENVFELKNLSIPKVVWEKMEAKMFIVQNVLKNFWNQKLHLQLFSPTPIYLNDVKIKLIEYLYETGISHPREIDWVKVCSLFDGMTTAFVCEIVYRLVRHVRRKNISTNFTDIVNYLYDVMIPCLKMQSQDKILPRISFKDKTVKILEEDEEYILKEECKEDTVPRRCSKRLSDINEKKVDPKDNSDVVWTLSKREKFLKTLLDITICKDIQELKDAIIPKVVWEEMEEKMKVDQKTLINLWYKELHMQLFFPNPIYMNDLKIKLIELIYKEQITDLNKIIWSKVYRYFDGTTSVFISQVFAELVNFASKEIDSKDFCDIMGYLYKTMIPKLKSQPDDKFLPRITFENKTKRAEVKDFPQDMELKEERRSSTSSTEEFENDGEIQWTLPMREKFIKKLLVVTCSTNVEELKDAIIPKVVWDEMEKKMNVEQKILRELWYFELHLQLFCPKPIFMNDIKIKLIEYFYNKQITDLRKIIWPKVCKYFDGWTIFFLTKVFYNLVRSASEEIDSDNLCEIVEYLHEKKIQCLKDKVTDRVLPRLSYQRGSIKIIEEDIKGEI